MKQGYPAPWCANGTGVCRADDDSSSIREMRLAQRMQNRELAANMGVSPARISVLERDERRGAVTLKMMQKAADALGCDFIYTLVPKSRLPPGRSQAQQRPKPRIQLDSSQLGDSEQQRLMLQQTYARKLSRSTQK
jgi:transcriptional regulator with XRE-family HTH domain